MPDIKPDGQHSAREAGSWNMAWFHGELAQMDVWEKASAYLRQIDHADSAKVFQGTADGKPVVYIFHRGY